MPQKSRRPKARRGVGAGKRPKSARPIRPEKQPRSGGIPDIGEERITWMLAQFDPCGLWTDGCDPVEFTVVADQMKSYERRTWKEIIADHRRDHPLEVADLSPEAQRRLVDLDRADIEVLWRLRFGARRRLWGIRINSLFQVLWWDPEHRVYPVRKKGT